jgi:2-polyprenyl-6-methoxyphenol hydroxylase-like FAD-dependent oxidoreductase
VAQVLEERDLRQYGFQRLHQAGDRNLRVDAMTNEASPGSESVLVVGAGPVGLAMGCELLRRGVGARVVDACAQATDKSKALGVQARTLEVLATLGIADGFVAAGRKIHGVNAYADGARIVHVSLDDIDSPFSYTLSLPQADTERLLAEHLVALGGRVEREVTLTGLIQDADGVTATLEHAGGRVETTRADWLVGCDGAHSATRHALGLPFEGVAYDEAFVLGDVRIAWELPDDETHAFISKDGLIAALPLPRGKWRLVADADLPRPTVDDLARLLQERGAPRAQLSDAGWIAPFRIHRRIVPQYRTGRVFLAGDAAHIHSPVGGQGMNTGIQDAHNLGWKLALVAQGHAPESLLDSYDPERRPIAAATLQSTDLATKVITLRNPVIREVRNRLAPMLSSLEVVQKRMLSQASEIAVGYRGSPIVDEHRSSVARATVGMRVGEKPTLADWVGFGGAPHPGDRAPDVEVDDTTSVHGLLRHTRSTLLLFDGAAPTPEGYANLADIAKRVRERWPADIESWIVVPRRGRPGELAGEERVLLDARGVLHRRYGGGSECLYLIRPDGYVGFRSQPASWSALEEHLASILR